MRHKENRLLNGNRALILLVVTAIILFATLLLSYNRNQANGSTQRLSIVDELNQLYEDDQQILLKKNITPQAIIGVKQRLERNQTINHSQLKKQFSLIEEKYQVSKEISRFFQTDNLINFHQSNARSLPLEVSVTKDKVLKTRTRFESIADPVFVEYMTLQTDDILAVLDTIDSLKSLSNQLPSKVNLATLKEDIQSYHKFEDTYRLIHIHPQSQSIAQSYSTIAKQFAQSLKDNSQQLIEQKDVLDMLFQSKILAAELVGSELDTRPLVALTFDDGPSPYTPQILDTLDKYDIQATFFELGRYIEVYPEITQDVVARGHFLGNHSYSHADFDKLSDAQIQEEINLTQNLLKQYTGKECTLYRTPYGNARSRMVSLYPTMMPVYWNVDSKDWVYKEPDATINNILDTIQPQSIILMHDSLPSTAQMLDQLIIALKERGYIFVTPDQIPQADNYRTVS